MEKYYIDGVGYPFSRLTYSYNKGEIQNEGQNSILPERHIEALKLLQEIHTINTTTSIVPVNINMFICDPYTMQESYVMKFNDTITVAGINFTMVKFHFRPGMPTQYVATARLSPAFIQIRVRDARYKYMTDLRLTTISTPFVDLSTDDEENPTNTPRVCVISSNCNTNGAELIRLKCCGNHECCKDCILRLLYSSTTCPICRHRFY